MRRTGKLASVVLVWTLVAAAFVVFTAQPVQAQEEPFGPWLDEMVWSEQLDQDIALENMIAGTSDNLMFSLIGTDRKERAFESTEIQTVSTFGSINEMSMNAAMFTPETNASLGMNPFADEGVREAMQWLMDREVIVRDILEGFGKPYVGPIHPDWADWFRELEMNEAHAEEYSFDFARAQAAITDRMEAMGATINPNTGTWHDADGVEIEIIVYARIEDERLFIGQYMADQLREVDFKVTLAPVPASTAFAVVFGADPTLGDWHVYTGGWAFTAQDAWAADFWMYFFHACGLSFDLFCAGGGRPGNLELDQAYIDDILTLLLGTYTSLDHRQQLIRSVTPRAFDHGNYRMWLVANEAVFPQHERFESFVFDTMGGLWSDLYGWSAKLKPDEPNVRADGSGGTMNVQNFIMFNDAWHPWAPEGWLYDALQRQQIGQFATGRHPHTGLPLEIRVHPVAETAGPVGGAASLSVPADAVMWDLERDPDGNIIGSNDTWIPVGSGVTAASKVTTHLDQLTNPGTGEVETIGLGQWHTGQDIAMADVIAALANTYRRGFGDLNDKDPSSMTGGARLFWSNTVKGFQFNAADNTVELWFDFWHPSLEEIGAAGAVYVSAGSSNEPIPWEIAEAASEAILRDQTRYSDAQADLLGVDVLDLARNPDIVAAVQAILAEFAAAGHVPVGTEDWITPAEATARYNAALDFVSTYGHLYASNGPFLMSSIEPEILQTRMMAFRDGYPLRAGFWDALAEFGLPEIVVTKGLRPLTVQGGDDSLVFQHQLGGEVVDPLEISWAIRDTATGEILERDEPTRTATGTFEVVLTPRTTNALVSGSFELAVLVTSEFRSIVSKSSFVIQPILDVMLALFDSVERDVGLLREQVGNLEGATDVIASGQEGLVGLVTLVLILAIIAIIVPVVMSFLVLKRLPPPGGG